MTGAVHQDASKKARDVALSYRLLRYIKAEKQARVFPFLSPEALTRSWGRVCNLAHVHDFVLHGLRHDGHRQLRAGGKLVKSAWANTDTELSKHGFSNRVHD